MPEARAAKSRVITSGGLKSGTAFRLGVLAGLVRGSPASRSQIASCENEMARIWSRRAFVLGRGLAQQVDGLRLAAGSDESQSASRRTKALIVQLLPYGFELAKSRVGPSLVSAAEASPRGLVEIAAPQEVRILAICLHVERSSLGKLVKRVGNVTH